MKNSKGRQEYGIFLNNEQLRRDVMQSKALLKGVGDATIAQNSRIDSGYKQLTSTIAKLGAGVGLGLLSKELYSFANAFDKSMKEVSTISKTVTEDMDSFKSGVLEMTTKVPIGADAAAKALYQIVSAGHDGAKGMQVLEVSAKAAIGGVTETVTAADAITTVLNAYKKGAGEAEGISDQLFTTVRLGKTTFGELGQSISQAVPIAASFGIESEQVLAAVATLTKSGTPTAQAMTQIRASIVAASKVLGDGYFKTHTFQEGLTEIARRAGGSESELRKLVPEIEAVNGVLGLTGINAKTAASDLAELGNSVGATEQAFAKMNEQADAQLTILKNKVLKKFYDIGQGAVDVVGSFAKFLNGDGIFSDSAVEDLIATLVVLISTVGMYKATMIAANAIQRVSTNVGYTAEIVELQKLLPVKQAAADADIHQAYAKGQITEATAERLITIRAEVAAELERLKVAAQVAHAEMLAAMQADNAAKKRVENAIAVVAAKKQELLWANQMGDAQKIEVAQQELGNAEIEERVALSASRTTASQLETAQTRAAASATAVDTMQTNLNSVSTRSATTAKNLFTAASMRLTKAFKALKVSFASNPIGMILTGVTMAISLFSMFGNKVEDAEKAISGVEKASQRAREEFDKEAAKIDALRYTIEKSILSYDNKKAAISELQKIVPAYNAELDKEGKLIRSNTEAIDDYLKALDKQIKMKVIEDERIEAGKAQREAQRNYDAAKRENDKKIYNSAYGKSNNAIIDVASWFGLKDKQKTQATLDKAAEMLSNANKTVKELNDELVSIDGGNGALNNAGGSMTTFSQQLTVASTAVKNLKAEITDIRSGKYELKAGEDAGKMLDEKTKALREAESKYNLMAGIEGKASTKDYSKEITTGMIALEQSKIDILADGRAKELAQIELTKNEKLAALAKERTELEKGLKEQGKVLTPEQAESFDIRKANIGIVAKNDTAAVDKKYDDEFTARWQALTEVFLTEEQKRTAATKNRYDKEREEVRQLYADQPVLRMFLEDQIDASEAQEQLQPLLDQYQDYADKRKDIEAKFDADIAALTKAGKSDEAKEAKSQKDAALKKLDFEEAKRGVDLTQLFGNFDNLTLPSMKSLRDKIKVWINSAGESLSPEDLKAVSDAFNNLEIKIADRGAFSVLKTSAEDIKKANQDIKIAQDEYNAALAEGGKESAKFKIAEEDLKKAQSDRMVAIVKANVALKSAANDGQQIVGMAKDVMAILGDLGVQVPEQIAGAVDGVGQMMDGLASFDLTKPMSIITSSITMIGGLIKTISSLFNNDSGKERIIQNLQSQIDTLTKSYELLEKAIEKAYSVDADKLIKESNELLEKQKTLIALQIAEEESKKDTDDGKIKEWKKQLEDINSQIEENKEAAKDAIFGSDLQSLIDDFASAYMDAWNSGEDRAKSQKDVVKNMLKGIISEMLKADIDKEVKKMRDKIYGFMSDDKLSDDEMADIDKMNQGILDILEQRGKLYDQILKGEDVDDREASKRGIATASQESVDENNGRLTTIQGHTSELNENVKFIIPEIASIGESMTALRNNSAAQLEALVGIKNNTAPIAEMREDMRFMRASIDEIKTNGILLKK